MRVIPNKLLIAMFHLISDYLDVFLCPSHQSLLAFSTSGPLYPVSPMLEPYFGISQLFTGYGFGGVSMAVSGGCQYHLGRRVLRR